MVPEHCSHGQLDQAGRSLEILGGKRVADRIERRTILLVPLAGPPMQSRHLIGLLLQQVRLQNICEEVMIAIPSALVI
jgi:hypothetical protein